MQKNLKRGFMPMLVIAVIAVLAIGGGVYVAQKNKKAKIEGSLDTQASLKGEENANENANLGVNANVNAKTRASLRSLFSLGQSVMCTFESADANVTSSGTVYLASDGDMRGDFESKTSTSGTITSHMITKDGVSFFWSGSQGAKMNTSTINASTTNEAKSYVDLDAQVDYKCSAWTRDEGKFTLPTGVNFVDLNALLKGSVSY